MLVRERKEKISPQLLEFVGIPKLYQKARLSDFPDDYAGLGVLKRFSKEVLQYLPAGIGLAIDGPAGHGKTHAAVGVLKEALHYCARSRFIRFSDLADIQRSDQLVDDGPNGELPSFSFLQSVCDLVLVDGVSADSPLSVRALCRLLEARIQNRKSVIITTGLDEAGLRAAIGDQFVEQAREALMPVSLYGTDWREAKQVLLRQRFS